MRSPPICPFSRLTFPSLPEAPLACCRREPLWLCLELLPFVVGLIENVLNIQEMTQMLPMGLVCLICFSFFGGVAEGSWFRLEIVGCNGSQPDPHDSPSCTSLLEWCPWLDMLMVAVMLVTLNISLNAFVSWVFF